MKKWLAAVLCATLCILLSCGAVNFAVDPLMQYRVPSDRLSYLTFDYDYVNPGLAENAAYDAVLVGTSLTENADMDVWGSAFGAYTVKLIYPGGTTRNFTKILDVAYRTHRPEYVFWAVDDSLFDRGGTELRHELPEYLYDTNPLNDVSYLLNLRIFYNYTLKSVVSSLRGKSNRPILRGNVWAVEDAFGKKAALKKHDVNAPQKPLQDETYYMDNVRENLDTQILPMLRAHPETQFLFFFPPKCITYWRNAQKDGVYDAKFYAMHQIAQTLLREENARVFFYADREEWTTDLSLYMDSIHFRPLVINALGEEMAQGVGELTADTADDVLNRCADMWRDEAAYTAAIYNS